MMRLLGINRRVPVDEIYIDLKVLENSRCNTSIEELQRFVKRQNQYERESFLYTFNRLGLERIAQNALPAIDVLKKHHKVMVLGKPGSGKTTLLRSLAVLCIKEESQWQELQSYVPIFISLRNFAEDIHFEKEFDLFKRMRREIQSWNVEKLQDIQTLLDESRVFLLLDGLDEVPDQEWDTVVRQIRLFCESNYKNRIIVSCRTQQLKYRFDSTLIDVEIDDFNLKQVKRFALNWFKIANGKDQAFLQTEHLMQQLASNKAIADLVVTPILLNLVCKVVSQGQGELPQKKTNLYKNGIRHLLIERDDVNNVERKNLSGLTIEQKEDLLSGIAYSLFEQNDYLPTQETLAKLISEKLDIPEFNSEKIMRSFESEHGLLIERFEKLWSFSHLTFHEYFVAREIIIVQASSDQILRTLIGRITEKRWREVFVMAVEISPHPNDLLLKMKLAIDSLLVGDSNIQKFLQWLHEKSNIVKTQYKNQAIRAFYIYLFARANNITPLTGEQLFFKLDIYLQQDLSISRETALFLARNHSSLLFELVSYALGRVRIYDCFQLLYLSLYFAYELALDFSLSLMHSLILEDTQALQLLGDLSLALTLALFLTKELGKEKSHRNLQILRDQLPDLYSDYTALQKWQQMDRATWYQNLLSNLVDNHDIVHDWKFSEAQISLLVQYVTANELLIDCLNSKCFVSKEVRQQIEDTFILPFESNHF